MVCLLQFQYYAKLTEAISWLNDRNSLVALRDYGKDEDTTQALIKQHEAIELEIEGYQTKITELSAESQRLVEGGHFDSKVITEREVGPYYYIIITSAIIFPLINTVASSCSHAVCVRRPHLILAGGVSCPCFPLTAEQKHPRPLVWEDKVPLSTIHSRASVESIIIIGLQVIRLGTHNHISNRCQYTAWWPGYYVWGFSLGWSLLLTSP